jgi:hypothetical protein
MFVVLPLRTNRLVMVISLSFIELRPLRPDYCASCQMIRLVIGWKYRGPT